MTFQICTTGQTESKLWGEDQIVLILYESPPICDDHSWWGNPLYAALERTVPQLGKRRANACSLLKHIHTESEKEKH